MSVPIRRSSDTLFGRSDESAATELESTTGARRLAKISAYSRETPSIATLCARSPARTQPTVAASRPLLTSMNVRHEAGSDSTVGATKTV